MDGAVFFHSHSKDLREMVGKGFVHRKVNSLLRKESAKAFSQSKGVCLYSLKKGVRPDELLPVENVLKYVLPCIRCKGLIIQTT